MKRVFGRYVEERPSAPHYQIWALDADLARCRRDLAGLEVFDVTGTLDFDRIAAALLEHLHEAG